MHTHIVLAHPEPNSFNGHLTAVAKQSLERLGGTVSVSDLYQLGFDPCERFEHYANPSDDKRFNVQKEQRHASDHGQIPADVQAEIEKLDRADFLILQYPMWWHLPPAMLKGWFDRVLLYGEVYTSRKRFEAGRFVGKRAMLSVTVGTSEETYAYNGRSGDIDLMLWPINFNLAYVGYTVLEQFVAYSVESAIRYSKRSTVEEKLVQIEVDLQTRLQNLDQVAEIPFNRMAEWDEDGRIKRSAPAYSPFIRHNQRLKLE